MTALCHWFSMGGYSLYVWSGYGIVAIFLLLTIASCQLQKKRIRKSLLTWFKQTS